MIMPGDMQLFLLTFTAVCALVYFTTPPLMDFFAGSAVSDGKGEGRLSPLYAFTTPEALRRSCVRSSVYFAWAGAAGVLALGGGKVAVVLVAILLALVFYGLPVVLVGKKIRRRLEQFEERMIDLTLGMVAGLRERETIRETFGKYVSPQIRDEILAGRAELAGGQREVTILFADLRGFSTWAESKFPWLSRNV